MRSTGADMEEKSDTPRTDAAAQFVSHFGWQVHADFARALERELATATRERDEARAIANDRDAMVDHRDRALTAMYQRVDVITRERDEARADLDRFRHTAKRYRYLASWCSVMSVDIDGNHYWVSRISSARLRGESFEEAVDKAMERDHWERSALAATEADRRFFGVGELERTGYIPAGSADEREAKP